jgi:rhamnulose-1-phosphate aldolase
MLEAPFPELDDLLEMMGEAGQRLSEIGASEAPAGNISICLRWPVEPRTRFPVVEEIGLPQPVPELTGATFLVSGSGRRLRETIAEATTSIGCLVVNPDGCTARMHTAHRRRFQRITSEFNSHLAVRADQIRASGTNFHAVTHAQLPYLTYLSHVPAIRAQPTSILTFCIGSQKPLCSS